MCVRLARPGVFVLRGFSLQVEAHTTVALVGRAHIEFERRHREHRSRLQCRCVAMPPHALPWLTAIRVLCRSAGINVGPSGGGGVCARQSVGIGKPLRSVFVDVGCVCVCMRMCGMGRDEARVRRCLYTRRMCSAPVEAKALDRAPSRPGFAQTMQDARTGSCKLLGEVWGLACRNPALTLPHEVCVCVKVRSDFVTQYLRARRGATSRSSQPGLVAVRLFVEDAPEFSSSGAERPFSTKIGLETFTMAFLVRICPVFARIVGCVVGVFCDQAEARPTEKLPEHERKRLAVGWHAALWHRCWWKSRFCRPRPDLVGGNPNRGRKKRKEKIRAFGAHVGGGFVRAELGADQERPRCLGIP